MAIVDHDRSVLSQGGILGSGHQLIRVVVGQQGRVLTQQLLMRVLLLLLMDVTGHQLMHRRVDNVRGNVLAEG